MASGSDKGPFCGSATSSSNASSDTSMISSVSLSSNIAWSWWMDATRTWNCFRRMSSLRSSCSRVSWNVADTLHNEQLHNWHSFYDTVSHRIMNWIRCSACMATQRCLKEFNQNPQGKRQCDRPRITPACSYFFQLNKNDDCAMWIPNRTHFRNCIWFCPQVNRQGSTSCTCC